MTRPLLIKSLKRCLRFQHQKVIPVNYGIRTHTHTSNFFSIHFCLPFRSSFRLVYFIMIYVKLVPFIIFYNLVFFSCVLLNLMLQEARNHVTKYEKKFRERRKSLCLSVCVCVKFKTFKVSCVKHIVRDVNCTHSIIHKYYDVYMSVCCVCVCPFRASKIYVIMFIAVRDMYKRENLLKRTKKKHWKFHNFFSCFGVVINIRR